MGSPRLLTKKSQHRWATNIILHTFLHFIIRRGGRLNRIQCEGSYKATKVLIDNKLNQNHLVHGKLVYKKVRITLN